MFSDISVKSQKKTVKKKVKKSKKKSKSQKQKLHFNFIFFSFFHFFHFFHFFLPFSLPISTLFLKQLDMGGGAAPIKLLHVIPHLDNSAKTGKPIYEKSKSGTSSKNNHVKFDKNIKQTKVLKAGAPRRNPKGTSTKSNKSNHAKG